MQMRSVSGLVLFVLMAAGVGGAVAAELSGRQSMLLANNCLQCHARPGVPAPQIGDAAAWNKLAGKGEAALLASAVQGLGGMPPLGYCSACTEQDLRALIRFMAKLPAPAGAAK
jgi:cytochrome c5